MSLIERLFETVTESVLKFAVLFSALAVCLREAKAIWRNLKKIYESIKKRHLRFKITVEDVRRVAKGIKRSVPVFLTVFFLTVLVSVVIKIWINGPLSFSVMDGYHPSGKMGDVGDITILRVPGEDQFTYETMGRGPHESDWKYVNGELNDQAAQFGGVMYLHPPNNFGIDPNGGRDLRATRDFITWKARSGDQEVYVEFVSGGINWNWDEKQHIRKTAPYPDSMPRTSLGTKKLTTDWQSFEARLKERGLDKEEYFEKVIGGFGWVISWSPNSIRLNNEGRTPDVVKKLQIEICDIRYERR